MNAIRTDNGISISYLESSGFLVSKWAPGETLELFYRRNPAVIKLQYPESLLATNHWLKSLRALGTRLMVFEKVGPKMSKCFLSTCTCTWGDIHVVPLSHKLKQGFRSS